ncbi:MAG TPA: DNA translocase FtsK 4TM domain-containing protein, partial [Terriglobales bacterium]|nr:DNA translocase FtsK 4TM domain-containing protein [Terriglobales bacterium]
MKYFNLVFAPTKNRRLNELVGFILCVFAILLFLALASYSPADPSFNSAAPGPSAKAPHNWIGMVGALSSDLFLQFFGVSVFAFPVMMTMLAARWWKSREVASPIAKCLGATTLLIFTPALLSLLPWHWRWLSAVPIEGLLGRIVGDFLVHYFNLTGAYILSLTIIAVAFYLSTAFSFGALQLWLQTRFAFLYALRDRYEDWREARAKLKAAKELAKRKSAKPVVTSQLVPGRAAQSKAQTIYVPPQATYAPAKSGIERAVEDVDRNLPSIEEKIDGP